MDKTVVVIIAAVVAVGAFLYARSVKPGANASTLSSGQALGAGILGLGVLLLAMPWAAGAIAALDFIKSSDFGILAGAVYALGILTVLGGIMLVLVRGSQES